MTLANSKWTKLLAGAARFIPEAPWVGLVVELVSQLATSMGATSGDSKETLRHIESLHSDLAQVTVGHAGVARQLTSQAEAIAQQTAQIGALASELNLAQTATKSIEARLITVESRFTALESRASRTFGLALASCLLTAVAVILLIVVLLHQH
jgi:septal ring factor EnvC (AmiA/AmiB activator)